MRDKQATVQDLEELPPFHAAARQGDNVQLSQLLDTHPDLIDYGDGKGFTALMHSVFAKSARCAKLLLECGSKPELKDGKGRTALHFCSRQGWSEGAELLIRYGAKCSTVDVNGRNTLHFGACSYEESCLEVLVNEAADDVINAVDCEGMTPLHWASFHNMEENVNTLLRSCANAAVLDNEHKTPLHWAAQNGCLSVCKSLLSSKYCQLIINQKASDSRTALHLATIGGNLEAIFELAQGKGFDAEIGDREGRTSLHWACAIGSSRCVAGLLRLGVKHDVVDSYGVTPLVYAKQLNQHDCATLIANFNPERPHDVLIPIESLAEHSNSIKKITSHRASMSNLEQDVFLLIPSCEKKQSNLEEVVLWQKQSLSNGHSPQPNKDTSGNTVDIEIKYSDCDSSWSADEEKSGSRANHLDTVIDVHVSEDELRYQPQMSLSPTNDFPHANCQSRRKKSEQNNGQEILQKIIKKPASPYKLAPIKSTLRSLSIDSTGDSVDSIRAQRSPNAFPSRKISTGAIDQRLSSTNDQWMSSSNPKPMPGRNDISDRPLGLRRKSLSCNDAIAAYSLKGPDKKQISRTQSYVQMTMNKSRLPTIDLKDGRNLTQQIYLQKTGVVNDILDEVEPVAATESKSPRRRKKKKSHIRYGVSRFDL